MWDAFFTKRNFYNKCKSSMRMVNIRMEIIMKKRSAMQKFLKNDVADLLRSNLDRNAYGRAHGVYMEMNLTWCYNYVQECCAIVADKLKAMQTEAECPEDCRVAVASLCYAAARFADLPELRDLRSLFTEKYGNALDPFVNKEFVEKLKSNPPTRETKLQLMKDIAEEFSIPWDPSSFDQNQQDGFGDNRVQQRVVYEKTASNKASTYKEVDQTSTRPYASNRFPAPYVKLKKAEDESSDDEEPVMDRLLRHYSMKTWGEARGDRSESSWDPTSGGGMYGRSVSMYANHMHPKLPDYDQLASRIQALRKM